MSKIQTKYWNAADGHLLTFKNIVRICEYWHSETLEYWNALFPVSVGPRAEDKDSEPHFFGGEKSCQATAQSPENHHHQTWPGHVANLFRSNRNILVWYTLILIRKFLCGGQFCGSGTGSGFQCFLDPRIRYDKKYGSWINIPDRISESFATIFWVKNTQNLCCWSGIDPVPFWPWIWDPKIRDKHPWSARNTGGGVIIWS